MSELSRGLICKAEYMTDSFSFLSLWLCRCVGLEGLFIDISGNVTHG